MADRAPWYVHVYANGWYGGAYGPFPSRGAAEEDFKERSGLFGILGCSYLVDQGSCDPRPRLMQAVVARLDAARGTHA